MKHRLSLPADSALGCEVCAGELDAILSNQELQARFQPIADLSRGEILGYVTRVRGVSNSLCGAANLLGNQCNRLGMASRLVALSLKIAAGSFPVRNSKLMFYTLPQGAVKEAGLPLAGMMNLLPAGADFAASSLVVVFPSTFEFEKQEFDSAIQLGEHFHRLGVLIASSDFGCSHADMLLWSKLKPDYVMLDGQVLESIDRNASNQSRFIEQLQREVTGRQVVATGIKTLGEFHLLKRLGIDLAAGDFFGRFNQNPSRTLSAAAHKAIVVHGGAKPGNARKSRGVLEKLLTNPPVVTPRTTAGEVFVMFENDPSLRAIAVVANGVPRGLIARYEMVDNMSRPFRHELFGRKPCTRFMDPQPLILDIKLPLAEISEMVVNADPRHLISGFIITDHEDYVGMGSVQDLVREITVMQMDAARYSNPLTQLPGNVPINQHIDSLLANDESCHICYCDLDHFKPFNDVYGYAKGDEVIQLTGRILTEICDSERDFIGHIGGDDFVLVLRSTDCEDRCRRALEQFGKEILRFFSNDDIERGGYVTENRKGQMEFQEIISLSIGAFNASPEAFKTHLQVSIIAAEVKKKAKAIKGNSFFINQRDYSTVASS
ncbi:MAG: EAL domain-containing protein [Sterolibacterium sp.]|jgi:GGDEF domain-containing protein/EAL domain-containing protein (putative c-di-GMP-specific phosphodiesterase class I)